MFNRGFGACTSTLDNCESLVFVLPSLQAWDFASAAGSVFKASTGAVRLLSPSESFCRCSLAADSCTAKESYIIKKKLVKP